MPACVNPPQSSSASKNSPSISGRKVKISKTEESVPPRRCSGAPAVDGEQISPSPPTHGGVAGLHAPCLPPPPGLQAQRALPPPKRASPSLILLPHKWTKEQPERTCVPEAVFTPTLGQRDERLPAPSICFFRGVGFIPAALTADRVTGSVVFKYAAVGVFCLLLFIAFIQRYINAFSPLSSSVKIHFSR